MRQNAFLTLLRCRLHWYALATGRLLARRWQTVVIVLGVLSPAAMPFVLQAKVLASPVTGLFAPGHGVTWRWAHLMVLQLVALAWSGAQRETVAGGPFAAYIASLPISPTRQRTLDLALLAVADGALLVPVATAVALFAAQPSRAFPIAATGVLVALVLTVQLAHLQGRWGLAGAAVLPGDLLFSLSLGVAPGTAAWALLAAAAAVAAQSLLAPRPCARRFEHYARWLTARRSEPPPLTRTARAAILRVQLRALFGAQRTASLFRLGAALGVAYGASRLMRLEHMDVRALPTGIIALAVAALIVGGFFRSLQLIHQPMGPFLRTLPAKARFWAYRDTALVICLGVPPLAVTIYPLLAAGVATGARLLGVGALYLVLLAALRWPQLRGGRHGVLLSAMLAGLWAWPALAMAT
ncbi:MAG: hypothetical protein P8180_14815 [Gammaproteobacteria bacterium]